MSPCQHARRGIGAVEIAGNGVAAGPALVQSTHREQARRVIRKHGSCVQGQLHGKRTPPTNAHDEMPTSEIPSTGDDPGRSVAPMRDHSRREPAWPSRTAVFFGVRERQCRATRVFQRGPPSAGA
jgi:hypothetical protein